MGPLLEIYLDTQKEQRLESQKNKIIADLMVWKIGAVLAKCLDLYWVSDMDLYLGNLLSCGSNAEAYKSAMVKYWWFIT